MQAWPHRLGRRDRSTDNRIDTMIPVSELVVALARNNRWANRRLHVACAELTDEEYFTERSSFFGTIHATLNHILIVDLVYLGRLKGEKRVDDGCDELHRTLPELTHAQGDVDREIIAYCEQLELDALESRVAFVRSNGQAYSERIIDVLTHLFLHDVHHRGQIHDMLSATSVAPPQLDEFFLAGDLDLRRRELEELDLPVE